MTTATPYPLPGGCDCGQLRYRLESAPLFVHCCHCRWCQRETGASFALNALIEADRVTLLAGAPERVDTPSASGKGQQIARCPGCRIAVWSHYAGAGPAFCFVRVGTLDAPDHLPPDVHIFTASKQPWVVLPPGTPALPGYYQRDALWPAASLARRRAAIAPLRQAERSDIAAMHRIRLAVRENQLGSPGAISEADYVAAIEATGRGWVVEAAGTVLGFAIGNAATGNIWALFVDPAHEGRGHGRRLHDAMVGWMRAQGVPRLWLRTGIDTRAQRFYEAAGWACCGLRPGGEAEYELTAAMLLARGKGAEDGDSGR